MKAIVQDVYGTADVLRLDDIPAPVVGAREVLVRVHAAGVDPGVWHLMSGQPYLTRVVGLRGPRVKVRGRDLAGVVEAVGPDVSRFAVGDEVFGTTSRGSYAELAVAPEARLAIKPRSLTFEQAAVVPVSGITALQAVRDVAKVRGGQRVLVIGAGGGIGTFVVQLAVAAGASVTGVCSAGKADLVRSLGADDVIDYAVEEIDSRGPVFDAVVDAAGNRPISVLRRALTPQGTLALVGGEHGGGALFGGFERQMLGPLQSLFVRQHLRAVMARENAADLDVLAEMMQSGAVTPVVDRVYPLADAPQAIRDLHDGHARGKSVVQVVAG